jgi:hypothetical protein
LIAADQLIKRQFEEFKLKIKIHAFRSIEADESGMDGRFGTLSLGTRPRTPTSEA